MADVFADLVAKIRIDKANFDRQLSQIKSQLSGFSAASLGNITLQNLESEISTINTRLEDLEGTAEASAKEIQTDFDSLNTTKAKNELRELKEKYSDIAEIMGMVTNPEVEDDINNAIKETFDGAKESTDDLNDSLDKTTDQTKKFGSEGKKATEEVKVGFSGIVDKALRAVAIMGTVELALGAVNSATKVFSGDLESAVESLERLPAGIGPVVQQMGDLLNSVTGWRTEAELIEESTLKTQKALREMSSLRMQSQSVDLSAFREELAIEEEIFKLRNEGNEERLIEITRNVKLAREQLGLEQSILNARIKNTETRQEANDLIQESSDKIKELEDSLDFERQTLSRAGVKNSLKERIEAEKDVIEVQKERIKLAQEELDIVKSRDSLVDALKVEIEKKAQRDIERITEERIRSGLEARQEAEDEIVKKIKEQREKREKAEKEAAERRIEIEQKTAERISDLQLAIQTKTLKAQGKEFEAQRLVLGRQLQEDLLTAFGGGNFGELGLLLENFRLDVEALKDTGGEPERKDLRSRFEDTLAKLTVDERENILAKQAEQAARRDTERNKSIKEHIKVNEDIREILKNKPGTAIFG